MRPSAPKIIASLAAATFVVGPSFVSHAHAEGIIGSAPVISRPAINSPAMARPSITNHAQNMRDLRNAMSAADGNPAKQSAIQRRYRKGRVDGAQNGSIKNAAKREQLKRDMEKIAEEK